MEPSTSGAGASSSTTSSFREGFELGRRRRRRRRSSSSLAFPVSLALFSILFCLSCPSLASCTSRGAPCELWPGEKLPPVYARCDGERSSSPSAVDDDAVRTWIILWRGTPPPSESLCEEAARDGFSFDASSPFRPSRFDGECVFHFDSVFRGASIRMRPTQLRLFLDAFAGSVASVHEDLGVRVSPMRPLEGVDGNGRVRRRQVGLAGRLADALASASDPSDVDSDGPLSYRARGTEAVSSSPPPRLPRRRRLSSSLASGKPNAAGPGDGDDRDLYQQDPSPWPLDRIDQAKLPLDGRYSYHGLGSGVNVYVVDTGVRVSHQEFGAPDDSDDEGSKKKSASRAVEVFASLPSGAPGSDCNGHGTHVAASVAGLTYGVAKNASIKAVRSLECGGNGTVSQVVAGLDWVRRNAVRPAVVVMALGGDSQYALDLAVRSLVRDAGIPVVVAAGNEDTDACSKSPARERLAITVAATAADDTRLWLEAGVASNYGSCVDLWAPGAEILSAAAGGDASTAFRSGTSQAAPFVAGALALLLEQSPKLTPRALMTSLASSGTWGLVREPKASGGFNAKALEGTTNLLLRAGGRPTVVASPDGLTVSGGAAGVASLGGAGTGGFGPYVVNVSLARKPTAPVTALLSLSDGRRGKVSPSRLAFSASDYDSPRAVVVDVRDSLWADVPSTVVASSPTSSASSGVAPLFLDLALSSSDASFDGARPRIGVDDRRGDNVLYPKVIRKLPFVDSGNTYFFEDDYQANCASAPGGAQDGGGDDERERVQTASAGKVRPKDFGGGGRVGDGSVVVGRGARAPRGPRAASAVDDADAAIAAAAAAADGSHSPAATPKKTRPDGGSSSSPPVSGKETPSSPASPSSASSPSSSSSGDADYEDVPGAKDVVYFFAPKRDATVTASLCGSASASAATAPKTGGDVEDGGSDEGTPAIFDSKIYVIADLGARGPPSAPATLVACADDTCGYAASVTWEAKAGVAYGVVVDGFGGAFGEYKLEVTVSSSPRESLEGTVPPAGYGLTWPTVSPDIDSARLAGGGGKGPGNNRSFRKVPPPAASPPPPPPKPSKRLPPPAPPAPVYRPVPTPVNGDGSPAPSGGGSAVEVARGLPRGAGATTQLAPPPSPDKKGRSAAALFGASLASVPSPVSGDATSCVRVANATLRFADLFPAQQQRASSALLREETILCSSPSGALLPPGACGRSMASAGARSLGACNGTGDGGGWEVGPWGPCSARCGGGASTRDATCASSSCDPSLKPPTRRECNTAPCAPAAWRVGPWSPCSVRCGGGGVRTRDVRCVRSTDGAVVSAAECPSPSSETPAPASSEACGGAACDFCAAQASLGPDGSCSGRGECDGGADGRCSCRDGSTGAFCEVPAGCSSGVADSSGECCPSGVVDAGGACCPGGGSGGEGTPPPTVDGGGRCCAAGTAVDACGVCGGNGTAVDARGACCSAPGALDAAGVCCASGEIDACGVCDGDGGGCGLLLSVARRDDVGGGAAGERANADDVATALGVDARSLSPASPPPALAKGPAPPPPPPVASASAERQPKRKRLRRSLLAEEATPSSSASYFSVAAGAQSSRAPLSTTLTPGQAVALLSAAGFSASTAVARPVCGNGVCEAGEAPHAGGACPRDCPLPVKRCPSPGGAPCGGRGTCLASAGACVCQRGYGGDGCDGCAPGFFAVGGGCAPLPRGQDAAVAAGGVRRSDGEGRRTAVVAAGAATGALAALLVAGGVGAAAFVSRRRKRNGGGGNDKGAASAASGGDKKATATTGATSADIAASASASDEVAAASSGAENDDAAAAPAAALTTSTATNDGSSVAAPSLAERVRSALSLPSITFSEPPTSTVAGGGGARRGGRGGGGLTFAPA